MCLDENFYNFYFALCYTADVSLVGVFFNLLHSGLKKI